MTDPSVETPTEDWAEQNRGALPTEPDLESTVGPDAPASEEVDAADRQEQLVPVYDADDEDRRA